MVTKIRSYGDQIEEQALVIKILKSMPSKFDHVVTAIEESKDVATLSFDA